MDPNCQLFGNTFANGFNNAFDDTAAAGQQITGEGSFAQAALQHATDPSHPSTKCICGKEFKQLYGLTRHIKEQSGEVPEHVCSHCGKGFWRPYKLREHTSKGCPGGSVDIGPNEPVTRASPIASTSGPSIPMLHDTNSSDRCLLPCVVMGCDRTGHHGFFQLDDLVKHLITVHLSGVQIHDIYGHLQQLVTSQFFRLDGDSQLRQLIEEYQTYWVDNTPELLGQDGPSQFVQPDINSQHCQQSEISQPGKQDNTSQFQF
ncbi:hypothetical protein F4806DRAFT_492096 [Annulohypoxylon nitens]|nr:hypothetical protein F4806DRAFT_492096 [Annulohypoxylon nitens]